MRYSTVFKFIAVILCAATLLGAVGSAAALVFLAELGGKSVNEHYVEQLRSQSIGYALNAGGVFASENLGGAPRSVIYQHYGNDWESMFFDWSRVGYTICDSEGNVVQEKEMPDSMRDVIYQDTFPVMGQYIQVISTSPREEYFPEESQPAPSADTQVHVMPAQESTAVYYVIVDYTDGHREEWPYDGTQLGALEYTGGSTVTFLSNIGELPMGDGWYPNHILFADSGGNVVYEAFDETAVYLGGGLDGSTGMIYWTLPAGTVTTAAPVGISFAEGDYTAYDAIPEQGITVARMNVTYGNVQEGDIASEGVSSPDLIGTIFHDYQGNAEFHSTDPMTMDIPGDALITHISFADAQGNLIFEARNPAGVGSLSYDEHGYLVFRGQMPGTVIPEETMPEETVPEETVPEETVEETTEAPALPEGQLGFAEQKINIYNMPSAKGTTVGSLDKGEEFRVLQQESFRGESWGLTAEGWILLEDVLLAEDAGLTVQTEEPTQEEPDAAEETLPEEAGEAVMARSVEAEPEEPVEATEPETAAAAAMAETEPTAEAMETAAEAAAVPDTTMPPDAVESDVDIGIFYDSETGRDMVAEYVMASIPEGYTIHIRLGQGALRNEFGWTLLRLADAFREILLEMLAGCACVFALCVVYLCCAAAHKRGSEVVRAGGLNRIPLDLYAFGGGFGVIGLVALAVAGSQYLARNDEYLAVLFCGGIGYLVCLILVGFLFAFAAQIKTPDGFWWKNTFCGWSCRTILHICVWLTRVCEKGWKQGKPKGRKLLQKLRRLTVALWLFGKKTALRLWDTGKRLGVWLWDTMKRWSTWCLKRMARIFGLLPITWQFLATGFVLVFLLYIMMRTYKVGYILLGFGIFFAVILYAASAFAILLENAKRMSKGDLDTKVDDRMLIGGFKEFAGELNDLAGVAVIAAQKQLKSERMKTELITNVSHDIKTPLTSIINYVDLLQKPHTEQQQEQYLEVLDRQSQRLKKLIDDLMEMSKASTGNLAVDIERVDAGEAVNQALGEFADKLDRAQLLPVFRQPEEQVCMMADGRLVWRVMSNLLGNAVKYALPGTRLYVDLLEMEGKVIISMKNISREELNVNAEELMERFVRGDASRNTEGSGLGLNIARSLMELQKGQLQILVDGDLFKVTLIFPGA